MPSKQQTDVDTDHPDYIHVHRDTKVSGDDRTKTDDTDTTKDDQQQS